MYKNTDIHSLGTDYTVADKDGKFIKMVQIIPHTDILEAALGPYKEDVFGSYDNYLQKSIKVLSGFDDVDFTRVLWHATEDDEVALTELIEYAIKYDYDRIILEHLEPTE